MPSTIIWTIAIISLLGLVLAAILYLIANKFKVEEDPRVDEIEKVMPGLTVEDVVLQGAGRLRIL